MFNATVDGHMHVWNRQDWSLNYSDYSPNKPTNKLYSIETEQTNSWPNNVKVNASVYLV